MALLMNYFDGGNTSFWRIRFQQQLRTWETDNYSVYQQVYQDIQTDGTQEEDINGLDAFVNGIESVDLDSIDDWFAPSSSNNQNESSFENNQCLQNSERILNIESEFESTSTHFDPFMQQISLPDDHQNDSSLRQEEMDEDILELERMLTPCLENNEPTPLNVMTEDNNLNRVVDKPTPKKRGQEDNGFEFGCDAKRRDI